MHVRAVRVHSITNVMKVKRQADRVPWGIDLDGCFSSPDKLAPAIIPVEKDIE